MHPDTDPAIDAMLRDGAWAVWSLSGGKDSSSMLATTIGHLDAIGHPKDRRLAMHADLGRAEWRTTLDHVRRICTLHDVPLEIVRHPKMDLVDRWRRRGELGVQRYADLATIKYFGPWSSSTGLFCRSEMKNKVGDAFKRRLGGPVVSMVGIRRDESAKRSTKPVWSEDAALTKLSGHRCLLWNPIVTWKTSAVYEHHRLLGIPLHEAYHLGGTRLSCAFCVLASANDLGVAALNPGNLDLYRTLVDMENRSAFSFQPTRWLAAVAPTMLLPDQIAAHEAAQRIATRRMAAERDIPDAVRFRNGRPGAIPDAVEAEALAEVRRRVCALHGIDSPYLDAASVMARLAELAAA